MNCIHCQATAQLYLDILFYFYISDILLLETKTFKIHLFTTIVWVLLTLKYSFSIHWFHPFVIWMNRFIELSRLATRINRKGEKSNYPRILRFYRKNVDRIISSYSGNLFFWWDDVCHQPFEWLSFSAIQRNSSIPNAPCMNRWSTLT